jgi:hypothetical protein
MSGGDSIKSLAIVLLIAIVSFFPEAPFADSNKRDHLFRIERSINKNVVQFDVRLMENSNLPDSSPVIVYWVLENGQQEELTLIQQKYAYGIYSQEKLEKNKFRIFLVALKTGRLSLKKSKIRIGHSSLSTAKEVSLKKHTSNPKKAGRDSPGRSN